MSEAARTRQQTTDVGQFEVQRQAFSRLMARFTADRDAMSAAVHRCNERIDALVARLDSGDHAVAQPGQEVTSANAVDVASIVERVTAQQESLLSEVRAGSERALQRADEALRRWRETVAQVGEKESQSEAVMKSLAALENGAARLEERLTVQATERATKADETARVLVERMSSFEEQIHRLDELLAAVRQQSERPPQVAVGSVEILDVGLRDLRAQVTELETLAAWTPKLQRLWVSLVASAVVAGLAVIYIR